MRTSVRPTRRQSRTARAAITRTRAQLSLGGADRTSRYLLPAVYCLSPYACHYNFSVLFTYPTLTCGKM